MIFYLKLSGITEAITAALKTAHPDMIAKDENSEDVLGSIYTRDIALHYDNQTLAGQFVMVKFLGEQELPEALPLGLTRMWELGGAPVIWAGAN